MSTALDIALATIGSIPSCDFTSAQARVSKEVHDELKQLFVRMKSDGLATLDNLEASVDDRSMYATFSDGSSLYLGWGEWPSGEPIYTLSLDDSHTEFRKKIARSLRYRVRIPASEAEPQYFGTIVLARQYAAQREEYEIFDQREQKRVSLFAYTLDEYLDRVTRALENEEVKRDSNHVDSFHTCLRLIEKAQRTDKYRDIHRAMKHTEWRLSVASKQFSRTF